MITLQKSAAKLVMAVLMLSMVQTTHTELHCLPHLPKWSAVAFMVASAVTLYKRKAVADFKPRYDVNQLPKLNNVLTKAYWQNLYYLWYDGFVGQKSSESYLQAEDGKIVFSEEFDAAGFLGNANDFVKPIKDTAGLLGLGYLVYKKSTTHPNVSSLSEEDSKFAPEKIIKDKGNPEEALHNH